GPDVLEMLTSDPINVTHDAAIARMQGWLVGPDRNTTSAVALVSPAGSADREAAVEYAFHVADTVEGLSRGEIHLAGPTYDSVAINQASKSSLLQFNLWSFLICITWIFACLKSIRLTWSVFVTAIFSEQISMALMYYSGRQMDSVLLLVANLTFVLTIAGGVHLVNYYLDARHAQREFPVGVAVTAARWPTLMAATTTALGVVSLCVSQITPIRNFGAFAALSVIAAAGVLLTLLPVMLAQFPPRLRKSPEQRDANSVKLTRWLGLTRAVVRLRWGILILAVAGLIFGVSGARRLQTSTRLQDLFSPDAKVMQDYRWLERHVAYLVPVEVVIQFPVDASPDATKKELASNFVQRMDAVEKIRAAVADVPGIGG
ncbi:MAG: MMPL family transporter, partial [Pirellulales bacterium]